MHHLQICTLIFIYNIFELKTKWISCSAGASSVPHILGKVNVRHALKHFANMAPSK